MNIAYAIMHIYPQAGPLIDFLVQDDSDGQGPYIAQWNLEAPQPTQEELQAAWEEYLAAEAGKPPVLTSEQRIAELEGENIDLMLALTQIYEEKEAEKAIAQEESINTMLAITEIYEMIIGGN
jgi:hypothetical protein